MVKICNKPIEMLHVILQLNTVKCIILGREKSSQVTCIYIALLTIQIVTKQLHSIKIGI